jgi:hypothetical protein
MSQNELFKNNEILHTAAMSPFPDSAHLSADGTPTLPLAASLTSLPGSESPHAVDALPKTLRPTAMPVLIQQ